MKSLLLLALTTLLFSATGSFAQSLSGKLVDSAANPIIATSVALLSGTDSTAKSYSITDENGKYIFESLTPGIYRVRVEDLTYLQTSTIPINLEEGADAVAPNLTATPSTNKLDNVVITYTRPIVEVKADKLILNVDGTTNAIGQNGLELLRKSPGVLVDKDDNVSLSGKNGVRIYIDGRPSPLSGTELSEYLKTIQSDAIDAIEIISNPSAKYEAEGNAGIVNIRLKKNKNFGTNGSVNLGYAVGAYPKYNGGISLNSRGAKMNVYGSYSASQGDYQNTFNLERSTADTFFNQKVISVSPRQSNNFKVGADYFVNSKSTLGVSVNGNISKNDKANKSNSTITYIPTGVVDRILRNNSQTDQNNTNINGNANYTYSDKEKSKDLSVDVDYGYYNNKTDQYLPNIYYAPDGNTELSQNIYRMTTPSKIYIASGKIDYEQNAWGGKLGIGTKVSNVRTFNDFGFYNNAGNNESWDSSRSNDFKYTEDIQALYLNYQRQIGSIAVQAGLRGENTILSGISDGYTNGGGNYLPNTEEFKRNYFGLFPSVAFSYNKNPKSVWSLSYARRIDRPAYSNLNPFEKKIDEYTFEKGNINLKPQYTNSVTLTHTFMYVLNTKLDYSHVSDLFARVIDTLDVSKSFTTTRNLADQDIISLNISAPYRYKKFSTFVNLNTYYSMYKADFGAGRKINQSVFSFNVFMQNSYKITDRYSAELSGWYTAPSIWQGTFRSIAMGGIDIGMSAKVLKDKGNLKVSLSDVLNTMQWGGRSDFAGQQAFAYGNWESRQLKVNFSYRFGNNGVKAANKRASAAEDEQNRVNGGSEGIGR